MQKIKGKKKKGRTQYSDLYIKMVRQLFKYKFASPYLEKNIREINNKTSTQLLGPLHKIIKE